MLGVPIQAIGQINNRSCSAKPPRREPGRVPARDRDKRPASLRGVEEPRARAGFEDVLAGAAATAAGDAAYWLYSSGSRTAQGRIHVHGNISTGDRFLLEAFGFGLGQRVFSSKLFFAVALGHVLIGGLHSGSTIILFDDGGHRARRRALSADHHGRRLPAFYRSLLRDMVLPSGPASKTAITYRRARRCRKPLCSLGGDDRRSYRGVSARPKRYGSWLAERRRRIGRVRPESRFPIATQSSSISHTGPSPRLTSPVSGAERTRRRGYCSSRRRPRRRFATAGTVPVTFLLSTARGAGTIRPLTIF